MPKPVTAIVSGTAPSPDPRVGLKAGWWDAGQAAWNMNMISTTPPSGKSLGATHSDLAFSGKYTIQGQYNGFDIWDVSNAENPVLAQQYNCPASQNDVSVYKNLLFMSSESTNSRTDCGFGGVPDPVSKERVRGIRVFDISDVKKPKLVTSVQTCRGSHTHTVVTQPGDNDNVYIYVSGTSGVRSAEEVPGCADGGIDDPNTARFRLEVIKVPLAAPEQAAIVSSPRIFNGLPVAPRNPRARRRAARGNAAAAGAAGAAAQAAAGAAGAAAAGAPGAAAAGCAGGRGGGRGPQGPPTGPNQCHDITVYPEIGLAGGACAGLGLLLDIRDAAHPVRLDFAADANMSFWHSATFNNDGTKVLFSDEWGGGSAPRCRDTDKMEWGADALFTIENNKLKFHSYYKMPAAQTAQENCVAHNGSLIPIPGRDVMVQAWYQGGLSVFDWTDVDHPEGDRVLRSRSGGRGSSGDGRLLVRLLVQRRHRQLRDRARPRHLRAAAESAPVGQRARGREDRQADVLEHAGSAEDRVAAELRAGARVSRSARAIEGARGRDDCGCADGADRRGTAHRRAAQDGADGAGHEAERRRGVGRRSGQGAHALRGCHRPGQRAALNVV